jgi:hypothetical protein
MKMEDKIIKHARLSLLQSKKVYAIARWAIDHFLQNRNFHRATVCSVLLIAGCAAPKESMSSLAAQKYQEMTKCVDLRIEETIERGDFNQYSYGPIISACGSEYGSLGVARYGAKLPKIPYEYWQLKILQSYALNQDRVKNPKTSTKAKGEDKFLVSYYTLQGQMVLANTAITKCPEDYKKQGEMLVLVQALQSTRELIQVTERFISLRDKEMPSNLQGLIQDFKLKAYASFGEAADSAFETQKQPNSCPKALDLKLMESTLNEYFLNLSLLDGNELSKELKDALQRIKLKAVEILKAVRYV